MSSWAGNSDLIKIKSSLLIHALNCISLSAMYIHRVALFQAIQRTIVISLRRYHLPCKSNSMLSSSKILHAYSRHTKHVHKSFTTTDCIFSQSIKGDTWMQVKRQIPNGTSVKLVEEENEYLHQVLEDKRKYHDRLMYFSDQHALSSPAPPLTTAISISRYLRYSDKFDTNLQCLKDISLLGFNDLKYVLKSRKFFGFCEHVLEQISDFSDTEFMQLLDCLAGLHLRQILVTEARNLQLLLTNMISRECAARFHSWDRKTVIKVADFFYASRSTACLSDDFRRLFFRHVLSSLSTLSCDDLVLVMYQVNLFRSLPLKNTHELEQAILAHIQEYSIDELAIICLAFFKTKTVIRSPMLMISILEKLLYSQDPLHSISVSAIMKALRYSSQRTTVRNSPHFQAIAFSMHEKCVNMLPTLSLPAVSNILGFYRKFQYMSDDFLFAFYDMMLNIDLSEWRVKDIARTIFHLSNISVTTDSIASARISQLEKKALGRLVNDLKSEDRVKELYCFPDSLVNCLVGLSNMAVFDADLLTLLFSEQFQNVLKDSSLDYSRDLFHLSQSVAIERADIEIGNLPCSIALVQDGNSWNMSLENRGRNPLTTRERLFQEVVSVLQSVYDSPQIKENTYRLFKLRPVLAHHEILDIEMCFDDELKPVPLHLWNTESMVLSRVLSHPPPSELRVAIVLHGPTSYMLYKNTSGEKKHILAGGHRSKVRQLDMLGYVLVQISYSEFNESLNKEKLITQKIQQAIHQHQITKNTSAKTVLNVLPGDPLIDVPSNTIS